MPDNHQESRIEPDTLDPSVSHTAVRGPRPSEAEQQPPVIVQPPQGDAEGEQEAIPGTPFRPGEAENDV